ncbi:MAG: sugar transferase [Candidatus Rifleibacteriota bacterium]
MKNWLPLLTTAILDSFAIVLAGVISFHLRTSSFFPEDEYLNNPTQYLFLLCVAFILWHIIAFAGGGYKTKPAIFKIDELLFHFKASLMLLLVLMSATFLYKSYDYSRLVLFFGWILLALTGNIFRQFAFKINGWFYSKGYSTRNACIIGSSEIANFLKSRIMNNPSCGLRLLEISDNETPVSFVMSNIVDELFIVSDQTTYDEIWELRENSLNRNLRIHLVPSFGNIYLRNLQGLFFDGTVMISLESINAKGFHFFLKRVFDLVFASFGVIALSPIMLIIAFLVKLDSPGPVFFKQKRVGQNGILFDILKFRTMRTESPVYAETPRDSSDPRITRTGRFLRSTGLDEIPQLFNVISGEMSIVGPRPEMPFIVEKYTNLEMKRLKAKPGITGLWQVYARSENLPIHHHIEYDLFYIENFTIVLDLIIILDTIPTAILRTGT